MHKNGILMHMRTTMILNDALIEEARRLTGLTTLVGLTAFAGFARGAALWATGADLVTTSGRSPGFSINSLQSPFESARASTPRAPTRRNAASTWTNRVDMGTPRSTRRTSGFELQAPESS